MSELAAIISDARARIASGEAVLPTAAELTGARLLDNLVAFLNRFLVFANDHQVAAVALWVAHSHAIAAAEVSPRLHIRSPERRCGKSRLMDLLDLLVADPLTVMNVTEAALFRTIADSPRTLLHDEIDAVFGQRAPEHEGLRALINAGHQRGRTVARMVPKGRGFETKEFPSFAATVLAGIGDLPSTVADRAIAIRLERKLRSEPVERFRRRVVKPQADELRELIAAWAEQAAEQLAEAWPELPDDLDDRAADGWEPLFAIADLAGGRWPKRARAAALALNGAGHSVDEESAALQLLASTREVFAAAREAHGLFTKDELLPALLALDDAPWGAWNKGKGLSAHQLGRYLRSFDVSSTTVRKGDRHLKGYLLATLAPAWDRYLNPPAPPTPRNETGQRDNPCGTGPVGKSENVTQQTMSPFANGLQPLSDNGCHVVTHENAEEEAEAGTEVDLNALDERCVACGSADVYLHRHDDGAPLCQPCTQIEGGDPQ